MGDNGSGQGCIKLITQRQEPNHSELELKIIEGELDAVRAPAVDRFRKRSRPLTTLASPLRKGVILCAWTRLRSKAGERPAIRPIASSKFVSNATPIGTRNKIPPPRHNSSATARKA